MKREIYLAYTDVKEHIDLSFLDEKKISTKLFVKGQLRNNNKTIQRTNSVNIYLIQELPDEYDLRIGSLIAAIGGEDVIRELNTKYQARYADIVLGIPCKTSELVEEGFLSYEIMQKLCDLKLGVQFYYT